MFYVYVPVQDFVGFQWISKTGSKKYSCEYYYYGIRSLSDILCLLHVEGYFSNCNDVFDSVKELHSAVSLQACQIVVQLESGSGATKATI